MRKDSQYQSKINVMNIFKLLVKIKKIAHCPSEVLKKYIFS